MTKTDLYIALFRHEDDVDVFTFYFVPDDKLKYPCPVKVAEHFKIECEPGHRADIRAGQSLRAAYGNAYCQPGWERDPRACRLVA